ncbi:phage holin [Listeria booriae]|uniref:phage holin n=1 Tax=Listeria booriae TaxID=1552123 RepID=UPI001627E690|nr:phage holin [Listeria booriae]MBC2196317.1 phage holin [Listeria booriae]
MKKINWKVRVWNLQFWIAIIPLGIVLLQQILNWFGILVPADVINDEALKFVNTVFLILGLMGIVVDPTTKGTSDSEQALTYQRPRKDEE